MLRSGVKARSRINKHESQNGAKQIAATGRIVDAPRLWGCRINRGIGARVLATLSCSLVSRLCADRRARSTRSLECLLLYSTNAIQRHSC
jgi:hypothetical protein